MAVALTAVDAVQKIIDVWNAINNRIEQQRAAEALAADLSEFGLNSIQIALKTNIENARRVIHDPSAPAERKKDLSDKYQRLYKRLEDIPPAIDAVTTNANKGIVRKLRRSSPNKALAKAVSEYRRAFRDFDQAVARADMARTNESYLLIQPGEMETLGRTDKLVDGTDGITTARVSYKEPGSGTSDVVHVLWETLESDEDRLYADDNQMQALARALSDALPQWHIPKLMGYEKNMVKKTLRLVFEHPDPTRDLVSLANFYNEVPNALSLTQRVRLCYQLARAVLQAHTSRVNVVHKHIRPRNVLLAVPQGWKSTEDWNTTMGPQGLGDLYLSGWQNARTTDHNTRRVGESAPSKLIYQHPERHQTADGERIVEAYNIGHDIYSLGVCMLELLTWSALVKVDTSGRSFLSKDYKKAFKTKGFDTAIELHEYQELELAQLFTRDAAQIQATLVHMSQTCIPPMAGDGMANLVCRCLTCLDPNPMYGGSRFHDGDSKEQISGDFCEEVLSDLKELLAALEGTAANE